MCPYCGSPNTLGVEDEGRHYELVTDCETCCRPIVVSVRNIDGDYEVDARAENE